MSSSLPLSTSITSSAIPCWVSALPRETWCFARWAETSGRKKCLDKNAPQALDRQTTCPPPLWFQEYVALRSATIVGPNGLPVRPWLKGLTAMLHGVTGMHMSPLSVESGAVHCCQQLGTRGSQLERNRQLSIVIFMSFLTQAPDGMPCKS